MPISEQHAAQKPLAPVTAKETVLKKGPWGCPRPPMTAALCSPPSVRPVEDALASLPFRGAWPCLPSEVDGAALPVVCLEQTAGSAKPSRNVLVQAAGRSKLPRTSCTKTGNVTGAGCWVEQSSPAPLAPKLQKRLVQAAGGKISPPHLIHQSS